MAVEKDYVKNLSNDQMLSKNVFDKQDGEVKILSEETGRAINDKVESSFQDFLNTTDVTNMSDAQKEQYFNTWLDTDVTKILDQAKIDDIKRVHSTIDQALKDLDFTLQLESLQASIHQQREGLADQVSLAGWVRIPQITKEVSDNQLTDLINKIETTNFKNKKEIVDYLNEGGKEGIRKIQYLLIEEPYKKGQPPRRKDPLSQYGTDGLMGSETFTALKNYVEKNQEPEPQSGSVVRSQEGGQPQSEVRTQSGAVPTDNLENNPASGTVQGNPEITGGRIDLNKTTFTVEEAKKIIEQEKDKNVLKLPNLESITAEVAAELANFEGKDGIELTGLKNVDKDVFKALLKGKCVYVKFKNGELIKSVDKLPQFMQSLNYVPYCRCGNNSWWKIDVNTIDNDLPGMEDALNIIVEGSSLNPIKGGEVIPEGALPLSSISNLEFLNKLNSHKNNFEVSLPNILKNLSDNNVSDNIRSEMVNNFKARFDDSAIITYNNTEMSVDKFCDELKNGNIDLNNKSGEITRNDFLYNEDDVGSCKVRNIKIFDKVSGTGTTPSFETTSSNTGSNGNGPETSNGNNGGNVEIAYDADTLISGLKKGREARSEIDALKLLLGLKVFRGISEELSYSIEGYELKGQEKKDLKKLRNTLRLFTNNHETTVTISDFFRLAAEQYSVGEGFDISKLGKEPSHRGTKKSYERFGELYAKYRKQEGGPYFKKVMGIMENYFLRGDVDDKSIRDLYQMENIGTWEGFIDPDKEREVFRGLFDGKNVGIDLGVPYQSSEQLKTLKKIVKKINLNELFQSGKLDGKGNNLGKREKQFYDLYQSYKKGELQGDNYYKKVFDFLVGAGRGNTTIVDAINAVNLIKIADVDFDEGGEGVDSKDEIHYNSEEEKKFILLLSDFNHDARVDGNDNGLKMGQQLRNIYKSINIDLNNAGLDDQLETGGHVWSNILSFAKQYFNNISNPDVANKLDGISKVEDLNKKIQEDPTILIALQNMLKNSSISINSICRYGDKATEMFMKELMQDEEMDEQYNKVFEGLVAQGISPTAKQALKPILLGSLMDNSVGVGLGAAYDAGKAGNFSAVLGVSEVPGVGDTVGLVVGYGNSIPAGDKRTIDLGASGGASYNCGFVPMFSVYAGTSVRVSDGLMNKDFDATTLTKIHAGANFTMIGTIPSWGISAGVSMDKLNGIDKQESMLRPNITSVMSEFLNDAEITGIIFGGKEISEEQKEKCITSIREKLGNKYGKMDEELLDKAANNIYLGFAYYAAQTDFANMSEQDKKTIKDKIINNIVNNYVTQRRNDKIEELNGRTTVSDVTVGVQFLADYWPIPMLGVTFTKYSNLYSRETPESVAEYESLLSTGQSMGYLERSVDENGNILPAAIKYLNDKLSIATGYDLGKMAIRLGEITEDGNTKKYIIIPRELCNSVNISLDPEMKDFIASDDEGFKIPVNTQLSLLTYTRTDATKFNLIIGDHKKENGDIDLNIRSKFEGDPMNYENKEGRQVMTKFKINEDMSNLFAIQDFPLSKCVEYKDGKAYFETRGQEIECSGSVSFVDGKFVVPNGKILVIKKNSDGKYTAECDPNIFLKTPNGIVVRYIDVNNQVDVETPHDIENLFESYNVLNTIFKDIEKKLSLMDNGNNGAYAAFMNAAATEGVDDLLDNSNYEKAFQNLSNLLKGKLTDPSFDELRGKLDTATFEEKVMIVDRFKAIFSYNDRLVNKHNLELQLKGRGNKYKELYGYDKTEGFPLKSDFDYRKAVQDRLNEKGTFKKEPNQNLVGMTAFYRLGDKNAGRSYMMTELGGTSVLGGETIAITDTGDLERSQNWFINNLNKSGVHKDLLRASLSTKLKSILSVEELTLSNEDLESLLRGQTIDIGDKKVRINVKYMFYLLGECANESIGVDLQQIVVKEKDGGGITEATISPDVTYEGVSGVYSGSAEAMSRYEIGNSNSATLGFAVGVKKPEPVPPTVTVTSKPTTTEVPTVTSSPTTPDIPPQPTITSQPTTPDIPPQPTVTSTPITPENFESRLPNQR